MILGLIVVAGVGSSHAALHPVGSDLYAEIPDAGAAIAAYSNAPLVRMVDSEGARNLGSLIKDLGFDIESVLGSLLPIADPNRADDRWWPWSAAQKISFSATGLEASPMDEAAISAWMICDFKSAEAAGQAEVALAAMGGTEAKPGIAIKIAGVEVPVNTIGSPLGVIAGTAWTARIDTRLVAGIGAAKPEEFAALCGATDGGLHAAWSATETSKLLAAPSGVTVLEILANMDDAPSFLSDTGALGSAALFLAPFLSSRGRWRIELQGDRFVTNAVHEPRGAGAQLFSTFGAVPVPTKASGFLPPDAVGTWVTSVDAARAESAVGALFASVLGDAPIAEAGAGEPRMADGLGVAMATSLLPFQSLMQPTPRIVLALELTDAKKFEAGLDAWIARAKAANPMLAVERKPYRKVPTIVIGAGKDEAESANGGGGSPFGGVSIVPTRVAIAVLTDRVLFTSAPSVVRNEIKRLQDASTATPHVATQAVARPADAVEVSTMDWAAFLSKVYDGARGVLPMLAQGRSEPIDLDKLPAAEQLFAPFRPSSSWARRDGTRWVVHSESSFGPETPLALAALGFLGMRASRQPPVNGTGVESVPVAPTAADANSTPPSSVPPTDAPDPRALTLGALREVRTAVAIYRSQFGRVPPTTADLLQKTDAFPEGFLKSGQVPKDGWGRDLVYAAPADGASYAMRSLGADGIDQDGAGDDVRLP